MTSRNSFQSALVLGDGFERLAAFLFEVDFNRSRQRNAIRILGDLNLGDSQALRLCRNASTQLAARLFDYPFYEQRSQSLASTLWWRALYIFMPGIEWCSIPWSSAIAAPQTFAGSVSNG
jgi:hypothetical protein